jgi:hypothetical protein
MWQVVRARSAQITALVIASIAILFLRRPDQFLAPAIFAEDGRVILYHYAARGLASIIEPVNGYHILATQLIDLAAFKISLAWTPEISVALVTAFTCAIVIAIALAPTLLPWRFLCALAALLVPSAPENFAVPLYAFWWAGLLLPLALLWDTGRGMTGLRIAFIVIGGLSSPLIVPFAALMALRAIIERNRNELVAAGVALAVAALQVGTMQSTGAMGGALALHGSDIIVAADRFAGIFVQGPRRWFSEEHPGLIVLGFMAFAALLARKRLTWPIGLLVLAWCAACAATMLRLPVADLDPVRLGARYFFYPLILFTWLMIWIAACSPHLIRAAFAAGFVLALGYVGANFTRRHEPLSWREHVAACARSEQYALPVHTEGKLKDVWAVPLTGTQCRQMIRDSLTGT